MPKRIRDGLYCGDLGDARLERLRRFIDQRREEDKAHGISPSETQKEFICKAIDNELSSR